MPRPVRSTRNKTVNYADYDLPYEGEAEYDSDYVPPTSADFRTSTAAKSTKSAVRRSPRTNGTRTSSSTESSQ